MPDPFDRFRAAFPLRSPRLQIRNDDQVRPMCDVDIGGHLDRGPLPGVKRVGLIPRSVQEAMVNRYLRVITREVAPPG